MNVLAFVQAVVVLPQAQALAMSAVASMNVGLLVSNTADAVERWRVNRSDPGGDNR